MGDRMRRWSIWFAVIMAWGGCRELKDVQRAGMTESAPKPLRLREPNAKFGMTGYQPALGVGHTGDGQFGTAGLPARGGGPVPTDRDVPYSLAPDQHIGTPSPVRTIRVIVDPATEATRDYAR